MDNDYYNYKQGNDNNEYDNNWKQKKKEIVTKSIFSNVNYLDKILDFISEKSKEDNSFRSKNGLVNRSHAIKKERRAEIVKEINQQLIELSEKVSDLLLNLENETRPHLKKSDLAESVYDPKTEESYRYEWTPFSGISGDVCKTDVVVLLSDPSLQQIKNKSAVINYPFSNFIGEIENRLVDCGLKYQFVFVCPFFIDKKPKRDELLVDRRVMNGLLDYVKHIVMALDPDYMISVGNVTFEKAINKLSSDIDSRRTVRRHTQTFFTHQQSVVDTEYFIKLVDVKRIRLLYLPHPYLMTLKSEDTPYSNENEIRWNRVWNTFQLKSEKRDVLEIMRESTDQEFQQIEKISNEIREKNKTRYVIKKEINHENENQPMKKENSIEKNDGNNNAFDQLRQDTLEAFYNRKKNEKLNNPKKVKIIKNNSMISDYFQKNDGKQNPFEIEEKRDEKKIKSSTVKKKIKKKNNPKKDIKNNVEKKVIKKTNKKKVVEIGSIEKFIKK